MNHAVFVNQRVKDLISKGGCPGEGRALAHKREGKGDGLIISVVDLLVGEEVKLYRGQPGHGFRRGVIKYGGVLSQSLVGLLEGTFSSDMVVWIDGDGECKGGGGDGSLSSVVEW